MIENEKPIYNLKETAHKTTLSPTKPITQSILNLPGGEAILNATVYPDGVNTAVSFEYGETQTLGKTITLKDSINGETPQSVSAKITGLTIGATYYFRNKLQTSYGENLSFIKYDLIKTLTGHTHIVYSVSFSPDGKTIASGSYKEIKLWGVE